MELEYLHLGGSHFEMHSGAGAEPVLVAWGITTDGAPVLLSIEPGAAESIDAWRDFLRSMTARGLRAPTLVVSDGGAGLIGAVELIFPHSARQGCLVRTARAFCTKWKKLYPAAVECLETDFSYLLANLRFPKRHWARLRHPNFIVRTFGESRRRVKVIGRQADFRENARAPAQAPRQASRPAPLVLLRRPRCPRARRRARPPRWTLPAATRTWVRPRHRRAASSCNRAGWPRGEPVVTSNRP